MKFKSKAEKIKWLKATAVKISEMEQDRKVAILKSEFAQATILLKAIMFAKKAFGKVSRTLKV